jgi:hypothetical protein
VGELVHPLELRGAVRCHAPWGFSVDARGGAGLVPDATTAAWRVAGVLRWAR